MTDVEVQAKSIIACGGPLEGVSIAVLRRAIQLEQHDKMPRSGLIRLMKLAIRRREREDARAPKDAA